MTNGTLFLDGKQYQYQDHEHLREILKRDYPNEPLPDWLTRKLDEIKRETKRREERC